MPSRVTDRMADASSSLLNGRRVGARLCHDVRARGRLEGCHGRPPCPMLMPSCPDPGEPWGSLAVPGGSVTAGEAPC